MKKVKIVNYLILSFFLFMIIGGTVLATTVEITGQTPEQVLEGQEINYTLVIKNIPSATEKISFDTDLAKVDSFPLYNFTSLNVTSDANKFDFPVTEGTNSITVIVHGQIPHITETKQCQGITLRSYKPETGYVFDRITLTNDKGDLIESVETRPFKILIPEVESFNEKLNKINDPFLKKYLHDLHDKGLVYESNALADYLIDNTGWPPYWWVIPGIIMGLVLGFLIGVRFYSNVDADEDDL